VSVRVVKPTRRVKRSLAGPVNRKILLSRKAIPNILGASRPKANRFVEDETEKEQFLLHPTGLTYLKELLSYVGLMRPMQ
jgi:hypothetical protein